MKVAVLPPFNPSVMVSAKLRWIFTDAYSVAKMCPILCDPIDYSLPVSSAHVWDFPGRKTGVGCHFLLQELNFLNFKYIYYIIYNIYLYEYIYFIKFTFIK